MLNYDPDTAQYMAEVFEQATRAGLLQELIDGLHYLIDMTDEPTGIRLMLPARTCLVENKAFEVLKAALELEAF